MAYWNSTGTVTVVTILGLEQFNRLHRRYGRPVQEQAQAGPFLNGCLEIIIRQKRQCVWAITHHPRLGPNQPTSLKLNNRHLNPVSQLNHRRWTYTPSNVNRCQPARIRHLARGGAEIPKLGLKRPKGWTTPSSEKSHSQRARSRLDAAQQSPSMPGDSEVAAKANLLRRVRRK